MPGNLPAVGTLTYNDYTPPVPTRVRIVMRQNYDASGRTVKYNTYLLSVEWEMTSADPTTSNGAVSNDANLMNIRGRLSEPGKALVFTSRGFGTDLSITTARIDSAFGPRPLGFSWEPIGSNRACRIRWECEFHLPECGDTTAIESGQLCEFSYSVVFGINRHGMTTRTVTGAIEIPMARSAAGAQTIPDTIDAYRDQIVLNVPLGFFREQSFNVSADKRRMEFSIVDTEIPSNNPYPKDVTDLQVEHEVSSIGATITAQWMNSITGSFEVRRGAPKTAAWKAFLEIVQARIPNIAQGTKNGKDSQPIWLAVRLAEELYTRRVRFAIAYRYGSELTQLLSSSGWGKPLNIAGHSWNLWRTNMSSAFGVHGFAGLKHYPGDDILIDLCHSSTGSLPSDDNAPQLTTGAPDELALPCPDEENSWLAYENHVEVRQRPNVIRHEVYQASDIPMIEALPRGDTADQKKRIVASVKNSQDSILQVLGGSAYDIIMHGFSLRAGFPIPIPRLITFGGSKAVESEVDGYTPVDRQVRRFGIGCPIYRAQWTIPYMLVNAPVGDLGTWANFATGDSGGSLTPGPVPGP